MVIARPMSFVPESSSTLFSSLSSLSEIKDPLVPIFRLSLSLWPLSGTTVPVVPIFLLLLHWREFKPQIIMKLTRLLD